MDTKVIIAIIMATIALIPGIFALIYETKKNKDEEWWIFTRQKMLRELEEEQYRKNNNLWFEEQEKQIKESQKKEYSQCKYCTSFYKNSEEYCPRCGAPSGP